MLKLDEHRKLERDDTLQLDGLSDDNSLNDFIVNDSEVENFENMPRFSGKKNKKLMQVCIYVCHLSMYKILVALLFRTLGSHCIGCD